ncbi:hypothetical protein SDC9_208382 [bioreactor metagenome]|uniref:Uncharacterized protein n=1 Tax=bioreactor metagenome TaxID=1076179 RepID=A0A645JAL2_9ZZZZ
MELILLKKLEKLQELAQEKIAEDVKLLLLT